ncbi:hypothetical protein WM14_01410 [Burkholderia ubonensis]|nr:hypothetical protein WM14_01410 [Burkholderia ubonensis]
MLVFLVEFREYILDRTKVALLDLAIAEGKELQERQRFFMLLIGLDVHDDKFRFAVLGDEHRLPAFGNVFDDLRGMTLQVADRLDLRGKFHHDTLSFGQQLDRL